ncbi:MAG TPA: hypothetical protein VD863_19300 [Bradyrhizobium sp.]|nr:hypothetical protein [Bradyrhizobium sp.]
MRTGGYVLAGLMAFSLTSFAIAQSDNLRSTTGEQQYVPRLGDIMSNIQLRHIKLLFAGKAGNWQLAAYELRQIKTGLAEAAVMYEGIPVSSVTTMTVPLDSLGDAITAKDGKRFAKLFDELTVSCNGCHQSTDRGYIAIRVPTEQPFSNQAFAPRAKP